MTKRALALILAFISISTVLYAGILDRIKRAWDDHDLEKTEKLVFKSLERDTLNPGAKYYYSLLFLDSAYSRRDIDSASYYIQQSIVDYDDATPDVIEDLLKVQIDISVLRSQKAQVGDVAFRRAKQLMVIPALEDFMERFSYSRHLDRAIAIRDSLAFDDAQNTDTWQAYQGYFQTYPDAEYAEEARQRYQKLIFRDYTKDDKLESYVAFLKQHPDTPYRALAESIIFERSTLQNTPDAYQSFLKQYPNSHLRKKASDILYYLLPKEEVPQLVRNWHPDLDSLVSIHDLNKEILFPIFEGSKFGFYSTRGTSVLAPVFSNIPRTYMCGDINENWLQVNWDGEKLVNRKGQVIMESVEGFKNISTSIKLVDDGSSHLYHASGFRISDMVVDDAQQMANGWIAFKHNYTWGILTPAGYQIIRPDYESIRQVGPFILLESDGKLRVNTAEGLMKPQPEMLDFRFEDYELIQDTLLQVFDGDEEAVIDQHLGFIMEPAEQEIYIHGSFWYVKTEAGYKMVNEEAAKVVDQVFESVEVNEGWLAFKRPAEWLLISRKSEKALVINELDSVKLLNDYFAFIRKGETNQVITHNANTTGLKQNQGIKTLNSDPKYGGSSFLILQSDAGRNPDRVIYNKDLEELFSLSCEEVTLLTDSLFKIKCQNKVGLASAIAKRETLSAKYEALDMQDGLAFLLRNGKIGCYDLTNDVLIPAEYTSRIRRIGPYYQVAKDGLYGLVDKENRPLFPPEYDEIKAWNDSSIWVRTNALWQLISPQGDVYLDQVQTLDMWLNVDGQQLAMVRGTDGTGIYSNTSGEILPAQYNEIINVGSGEEPVFFAEQHLKTAAFYVVTYFNLAGETLKSQAFRPEEYDQIYCDE